MSPFPRVERVRNDKSRRQDAGQAPSIPEQNGGALLFSVAVASRRSRCGIRHTQVGVYKPKGTTRIPLQDIPETMHIVPFCTSVKLDMDMSSLYLEELHLIAFPIWEAITGTAPNPQDFIRIPWGLLEDWAGVSPSDTRRLGCETAGLGRGNARLGRRN